MDLHKRAAQVAVRDHDEELIDDVRLRLADLEALANEYAGGKAVIEATTNYFHVYDSLSEQLDVFVAHPPKLKAIARTDKKTDKVDVTELSRLMWVNSVPRSHVPTDEPREAGVLVRGWISLQEERTRFINKIHALLLDKGITRNISAVSEAGRQELDDLELAAPWDGLLASYLSVMDTLSAEIDQLDARIRERAEHLARTQLLMSIPGISHYSALVISAELGEIARFDTAKQVVRYVGLNPVIRESADSQFVGSISKNGSGTVRWLLVQAVHSAVYTVSDPYLRRFYERIERRENAQIGLVATAGKLLISIFDMLDLKEVYDLPGVVV